MTKVASRAPDRARGETLLQSRRPDADQIAEGLKDLAAAIREGTETFRPAAETVHGFGARLDALCRWVTGKWPWILGSGLYLLQQVSPEIYEAAKAALAGIGPAS